MKESEEREIKERDKVKGTRVKEREIMEKSKKDKIRGRRE